MKPRRANARNAMQGMEDPPIPDKEVSNADFMNCIQMLAQSMTNQNNRVHATVNENGGSAATRFRDFVRIKTTEFLGSQTNEDTQNFLDEINKIFEVMQISGNDQVE